MIYETNFQQSIEEAFLEYGASVAQERSIADVRDGLKIGLRQGLYAQYSNKLTHKNKFQKAQKSVAAAMSQSYVHGDAAMYSTFIRAAKPWSYRYPIEEAQGSFGTQCGPNTHSSSRYVEMRSGEIADYFFEGLKQDAVDEWYDNYDDTEKIPSVFPSIGFWNIVNGCNGIAVAMATSVPQFNLKEVNSALVKLIKNPEIDFNEIYCAPDFSTGGLITNASEVKKSLEQGKGSSIRMRANLEYDSKNHMIKATELPYGVFTDTIIEQLAKVANDDENYGIERVIDHTKQFADIRIYLSKTANPSVMIKKLYHDTSLENWFAINMIMLDHGRFPRVFGWKDACQAYIDHIRECKTRMLQFELNSYIARNHILDGLLMALANIDEVVATIRHSESAAVAKTNLIKKFGFSDEQAKAILDMKLQRLANLEHIKVEDEREKNSVEIDKLRHILNTPLELNQLLIDALEEVSRRFGDNRRTKISNIIEAEQEEEKEYEVMVRVNSGKITLTTKKLAGQIIYTTNLDTLVGIDRKTGKMYRGKVADIPEVGITATNFFKSKDICFIESGKNMAELDYLYFTTSDGYVKKTKTSDFNFLSGRNGVKVYNVAENAEITNVYLTNDIPEIESNINFAAIPVTGKTAKGTKLRG